ncbi:hypothetical protein BH23PAT2_BH23PAT2_02650 [soil metagenome]
MKHLQTSWKALLLLGTLLLLVALFFIATPPVRYGTYGDNFQCGEVNGIEYHSTLTAHYLSSGPLPTVGDAKERIINTIGVCPYDNYFAKTWAGEIWLLSALLFGSAYYAKKKSKTIHD